MAVAKPSVSELRLIYSTEWTDEQVQAMIDDAAALVENCSAVVAMSEAMQKMIVKYVAAHLMSGANTLGNAVITSDRMGDASRTYSKATMGSGLAGTSYGQMAIGLDPSGCLARLGQPGVMLRLLSSTC